MRFLILIAGLALYVAALFVPAVVFKPDVRSNPKYGECASGFEGRSCEAFTFGRGGSIVCEPTEAGKTYIDKAKILEYCKGWDTPIASSMDGYEMLLMGWAAVLLGMLAWLANPLMLMAVLLSAFGVHLVSRILSGLAVAVALQSYLFEGVPFTGGSVDAENRVDYLGLGFYLWMASLVLFAAYCFLKKKPAVAKA